MPPFPPSSNYQSHHTGIEISKRIRLSRFDFNLSIAPYWNCCIDIVDFTEVASAFLGSGNLAEYTKRIQLKRLISKDLSKPIRRYDSDIEYIPTQFICEYIRYIIGADGILFNSSLDLEGKNIVLFNQDKIECINVKKHIISNLDIDFEDITP